MSDKEKNKSNRKIEAIEWGSTIIIIIGILVFFHYWV